MDLAAIPQILRGLFESFAAASGATGQRKGKEFEHEVARLLAQREPRPIRLGLYFPLLGEWREWTAPGAQYQQASLFEP